MGTEYLDCYNELSSFDMVRSNTARIDWASQPVFSYCETTREVGSD